MGCRLDAKPRLIEEYVQSEIKRLGQIPELTSVATWRDDYPEICLSKAQARNNMLLEKEIKTNAKTCNMIRRSLLKHQNECDYAQYEKELNSRGLAIHIDRR